MGTLRTLSKISASALLLAFLASGAEARDPVDAYVQAQMRARTIPGLSLAVVRHGKVVKAAGYGMANVELSVAATQHTVYELASMTKPFTALAIMLLLRDGKLSLDDPVVRYVVEVPDAWRGVTIRHLLSHTSGIPNHTDLPVIINDEGRDYTRAEMLAFLAAVPVEFPPGKRWAYNNSGYFLLALVIEKAGGQPYEQFLSERIFRPLDMTATRGNNVDELIRNRAAGYVIRDGRLLRARRVSPTQTFGGGHLVSTVLDLAKWDAALARNRLFPKSVLEQMWNPAQLDDGRRVPSYLSGFSGSSYGLGWLIGEIRGHRVVEHGGSLSWGGFSSEILSLPDDGLTVIVLVNRSQDPPFAVDAPRPWDIARGVGAFYLPDLQHTGRRSECQRLANHDSRLSRAARSH